jgi:hypothetical protein
LKTRGSIRNERDTAVDGMVYVETVSVIIRK